MPDRPNIVWFMSEDCSPHAGAYGDPLAGTPTIDRMAAEGVLFENAFCTSPVCAPSRFSLITGVHAESAGAHHMRSEAHVPDSLDTYSALLREAGYYCTNNSKTDYNSDLDEHAIWDESSTTAHWRNRPDGAPFLAVVNDLTTHESSLFRGEVTDVRPEDVRLPAYLPDTPEIRADIARYYTAVGTMDAHFGEVIAQLEDDGLLEDTIVLHSSDHGGVVPRTKRFCYDDGLRVPLIVRLPERWRHLSPWAAGERVRTAVSQIDVPPTLLSLGGARIPDAMQGRALFGAAAAPPAGLAFGGRNRMDERYDFIRTVRDERYRYLRNYAPHRPWGQYQAFAWLAAGYRSWEEEHLAGRLDPVQDAFWQPKPAEEFYDTAADPDEVASLIGAPEHAERIARFRSLLYEHMIAINDNGFLPEGSPLEGYEPSRAPGAYPLAEVIALADRAIAREEANLPAFAEALHADDEVLRFWGVQGLLMLHGRARPAADELRAALDDRSPQVRVAAAEALAWAGDQDAAVTALVPLVAADVDWRVRLQALNALTYLPEPAYGVLPVIEPIGNDDFTRIRDAARYLLLRLKGEYTPRAEVFDWDRFLREIQG